MRHWRKTRRLHERSKRRRRARSSQSLKSAGCIVVTDEPHNVGDPVSSRTIWIKSMANQWNDFRRGPRSMRIVAKLRAVDVRSSHQYEEEIGAASSENGLFIAKVEFSVRTGGL